jgi:hypothetical protein
VALTTDWVSWHAEYEDPTSRLSQRVAEVRKQLSAALDRAPVGPIRIISACAGEGRDVIPVVSTHRRRDDITARLVELDPDLAQRARAAATPNVEVVTGDASVTSTFDGAVPANIALFCGIFGNITDDDIEHTVRTLPSLLAPGGEVLWTRYTAEPDLTPTIRDWFADAGFAEMDFVGHVALRYGVGTHRLVTTTPPAPFAAGVRLFTFVRQTDRVASRRYVRLVNETTVVPLPTLIVAVRFAVLDDTRRVAGCTVIADTTVPARARSLTTTLLDCANP